MCHLRLADATELHFGMLAKLRKLTGLENSRVNPLKLAWNRLSGLPGGKILFSQFVGKAAPYTGSISAVVQELKPGYSRVTMSDSRKVRNHLRSVHAIALANLAELAGNIALAYSLPDDGRFIVAGIELEYLKKARGRLTAECECPVPISNERLEFLVPVVIRDASGDEVTRATLRSLVGPKKKGKKK